MARPGRTVNPLIGQRIQEARNKTFICIDGKQKRMTQKALADRLSVSLQAVRNWEQGLNSIEDFRLIKIAELCNVDYLWLKGLDIASVTQASDAISNGFCPSDYNNPPNVTIKEQAKSLALIYSLKLCGHSLDEVLKKDRYCSYMEEIIKFHVEFYMKYLNKNSTD